MPLFAVATIQNSPAAAVGIKELGIVTELILALSRGL
jgi:hypothetical protein